jgi:secondary thiamine-phosphate synthase enzyme
MWWQKTIRLAAKPRGFHLITQEIENQFNDLPKINTGLAHLFLQHTSASLALNENADADVRIDMEQYFSRLAPENQAYFRHTAEGPDDMPAHIKNVLLGSELTLPISQGRFALGVWQGLYLCEHRNQAGSRSIIATVCGE